MSRYEQMQSFGESAYLLIVELSEVLLKGQIRKAAEISDITKRCICCSPLKRWENEGMGKPELEGDF